MNNFEFSLDDFCSVFCDNQYYNKSIDQNENYKQEKDAEDSPTMNNSQSNQSAEQLQQQSQNEQINDYYHQSSIYDFIDDAIWGENSQDSQHPQKGNNIEIHDDGQQQFQQRVKKQKLHKQRKSENNHEKTKYSDIYDDIMDSIQQDSIDEKRWDKKTTRKFEILVSCIGVSKCKVEDYQQYIQIDHTRDRQMTHLQKYRRSILKQYGLKDKKQIKNYMYRKASKNASILKRICIRWRNPNFKGYTRDEILAFLNKN